jgi:hypothetical protein
MYTKKRKKQYQLEVRFVKQTRTWMSDISSHTSKPNLSHLIEHVSAWYGLVDARICAQGCSPRLLFHFDRSSVIYICTCSGCLWTFWTEEQTCTAQLFLEWNTNTMIKSRRNQTLIHSESLTKHQLWLKCENFNSISRDWVKKLSERSVFYPYTKRFFNTVRLRNY